MDISEDIARKVIKDYLDSIGIYCIDYDIIIKDINVESLFRVRINNILEVTMIHSKNEWFLSKIGTKVLYDEMHKLFE